MSVVRGLVAAGRGALSVSFFAVFGIGSLIITPFMLVLRTPARCQPIVRAAWRVIVRLFVGSGLIRIAADALTVPKGSVIVANHPSLIDVVLVSVLVPRTLYVAKRALRKNPFLAAIVRATSLPDDERLLEAAAPYLRRGWNVLVFPEGTRSPSPDAHHPFRRGAAQVALRTGAPLVPLKIDVSRRILGKGQGAWDLGDRCVTYRFRAASPVRARVEPGESRHAAARRITGELEKRLF